MCDHVEADEIPLSFISGWWCAAMGDIFAAISGMPDNPDHRIVRDDEVKSDRHIDGDDATVGHLLAQL